MLLESKTAQCRKIRHFSLPRQKKWKPHPPGSTLFGWKILFSIRNDFYRVIFSIGHNVLKKFPVLFLLSPAYTSAASPTEWDILFAVLNAEKDAKTIVNGPKQKNSSFSKYVPRHAYFYWNWSNKIRFSWKILRFYKVKTIFSLKL